LGGQGTNTIAGLCFFASTNVIGVTKLPSIITATNTIRVIDIALCTKILCLWYYLTLF